jgi:flagellar protein FlbD
VPTGRASATDGLSQHHTPKDGHVIILTRLGGHQVAVNPDLIERAEPTPDTVITMVDGHKLVVAESVPEVVDAVRTWRASIAAEAHSFSVGGAVAGGVPGGDVPSAQAAGAGAVMGVDRATDLVSDDVAAHSAVGASLARVLRMPLADRGGRD